MLILIFGNVTNKTKIVNHLEDNKEINCVQTWNNIVPIRLKFVSKN